MKKLLVLGGTKISCQIVNQAKRMGIYTSVSDYNAPEESPAKWIADQHYRISATDVDGIVELIRKEQIDGVIMGFADVLMPAYAKICKKAGLPAFFTPEQAELFTNKKLYKPLLRQYGIPTPASVVISKGMTTLLDGFPYPAILKPVDNSGARGCTICANEQELQRELPHTLAYSASRTAILEEYIEGPEVTAFFVIQDGEAYFTALGNRHVENHQGDGVIPLPVGYSYPSMLTGSYAEHIAPKVAQMLRGENISNGMLFMQCIVKDGVPMVYDLGLRLTGSLEYHMLEAACGYNPLEMMISYAVAGSMGPAIQNKVDPFLNGKFGWNISSLQRPGVVDRLWGLDRMCKVGDLIISDVSHDPGNVLAEADIGTLKQISCRFIGLSPNRSSMCEATQQITELFDVTDADGKSLLLPAIDFQRYLDTF